MIIVINMSRIYEKRASHIRVIEAEEDEDDEEEFFQVQGQGF